MKKLFIFLMLYAFTTITIAQNKSMIEMKVMQTRAFDKPYKQVIAAINEMWTNLDAECDTSNYTIGYAPINLRPTKGAFTTPAKTAKPYDIDGYKGSPGKISCVLKTKSGGSLNPEYEIFPVDIPAPNGPVGVTEIPEGKKTIVRLRYYLIYNSAAGGRVKEQITKDEQYREEFKALADALFVNAIELTPQEMQ
jgi:hypothetical protein